ncbi:hypothetical protein P3S67_002914 [Capsicum chacoense]
MKDCKTPGIPPKNYFVYECHFCSHRNVKRGTPRGYMNDLYPAKPKTSRVDPVISAQQPESLNISIRQELTLLKAVEAAHDAQMKCVAVACKHPLYELGAADLVVRHLDELSIVDLKNLSAVELTEFGSPEPELEEEDDPYPPICGGR